LTGSFALCSPSPARIRPGLFLKSFFERFHQPEFALSAIVHDPHPGATRDFLKNHALWFEQGSPAIFFCTKIGQAGTTQALIFKWFTLTIHRLKHNIWYCE